MFQERALQAISRQVQFDACMWGIGTTTAEGTSIKGAHLWNFSEEAIDILNREDPINIVGKAMREQPNRCHIFSSRNIFPDPETEFIWKRLGGVREVMCHGSIDAKAGLMSFFAIARHSDGHAFTGDEGRWIEILAPHLEATLQICRVSELQQQILDVAAHHTRSAVSDARGVLHVAEPGFTELLLEAWPNWQGPHLPRELIRVVSSPDVRELQKSNVTISISGAAQQLIITATRRSSLDLLTSQERAMAEAFAKGHSYKEVARLLQRSPATVRHHLRSVYSKLGVRDKGALAHVIFGHGSDRGA